MQGTIRAYVDAKGFGFIQGDDGKSYYFRRGWVDAADPAGLDDGALATFDPHPSPRGLQARRVVIERSQGRRWVRPLHQRCLAYERERDRAQRRHRRGARTGAILIFVALLAAILVIGNILATMVCLAVAAGGFALTVPDPCKQDWWRKCPDLSPDVIPASDTWTDRLGTLSTAE